ncbi:MAG: hypothetical protein R2828_29295 [Saprospiraceae bacterium]
MRWLIILVCFLDESDVKNEGGNNAKNPELFVRIDQIRITSRKECWSCGKAEVRVSYSIIDTPTGAGSQDCSNITWNPGTDGIQIAHVSQSKLHEWLDVSLGVASISNGTTSRFDPGETYVLIMFEYDSGASLRELIFNPCYHSYYFRSNDSEYVAWGPGDNVDYGDFNNPTSTLQMREKMDAGGNGIRFEYRYD